jgi:serine/threonine-protein kinase HipA
LCEVTLAQLETPDSSLKQRLPGNENFVRFADLIADRARRLLIKAG